MTAHAAMPIRWLEDNGYEHLGVVGDLLVPIPYHPPCPESLARVVRAVQERAQVGHAPRLLMYVPPDVSPPDMELRPAIQATVAQLRPMLSAMVVVVPGAGFSSAAQRGAVTAVFMFARLRRFHVCAKAAEAIAWLDKHSGPLPSHGSLAAMIAAKAAG